MIRRVTIDLPRDWHWIGHHHNIPVDAMNATGSEADIGAHSQKRLSAVGMIAPKLQLLGFPTVQILCRVEADFFEEFEPLLGL